MPATAYQGHATYSASEAVGTNPDEAAPADRYNYDPSLFAAQPGAAARAGGYPRHDGQGTAINAGGTIANGSARRG